MTGNDIVNLMMQRPKSRYCVEVRDVFRGGTSSPYHYFTRTLDAARGYVAEAKDHADHYGARIETHIYELHEVEEG